MPRVGTTKSLRNRRQLLSRKNKLAGHHRSQRLSQSSQLRAPPMTEMVGRTWIRLQLLSRGRQPPPSQYPTLLPPLPRNPMRRSCRSKSGQPKKHSLKKKSGKSGRKNSRRGGSPKDSSSRLRGRGENSNSKPDHLRVPLTVPLFGQMAMMKMMTQRPQNLQPLSKWRSPHRPENLPSRNPSLRPPLLLKGNRLS